jgi:hypothetical protein
MPAAAWLTSLDTVLNLGFLVLGGTSFSPSVHALFPRGLWPLNFQGLKPLISEGVTSGLKSRPPKPQFRARLLRIRTLPHNESD